MSQRDVVAELRAVRVEAPPELRARVRLIAAAAEPPRRRITLRRALVVAVPLAAALAAGIVALTRPSHEQTGKQLAAHGSAAVGTELAPAAAPQRKAVVVPTPAGRATIYDETLSLQLRDARAVSDGVKRALAIAASLSGYATSVHASSGGGQATADLVLKVPRTNVVEALSRLSQLGTIVAEQADVTDAQAGLNATDRTIARLQRQLKKLRAQEPAPAKQIVQLERRIVALQRSEAATRLRAHYATISLRLSTKPPAVGVHHGHGPLHGVVVALTWLGIGALYALAVGGPVTLLLGLVWFAARAVLRRREEALLSRP